MDKLKEHQSIIGAFLAAVVALMSWGYALSTWTYQVDAHIADDSHHITPSQKKFIDTAEIDRIKNEIRNALFEYRLTQLEELQKCN